METAAHGASGDYFQSLENRGLLRTHHFPLAPAMCSEEIWGLRQTEIPFLVQEILQIVALVKEKKNTCHIFKSAGLKVRIWRHRELFPSSTVTVWGHFLMPEVTTDSAQGAGRSNVTWCPSGAAQGQPCTRDRVLPKAANCRE